MKFPLIRLLTPAEVRLFERGHKDADYLERWRDSPRYTPPAGQSGGWHSDHYEVVIAPDGDAALFDRAADLLMRYCFYPPTVMSHVSTFGREGRWLRPGDRIVQRIHIVRPFGIPVVDVLAMNEITRVIDEPRRKGFTYATTTRHSEEGEWSALVEWRPDNALVLRVSAISRLSPRESRLIRPFTRWLQKRAHRLGIAAFRHAVTRSNRL